MFGSHLSIAGGLHNALIEARELGMDCVQVFTKNQRQWNTQPLGDEAIALWREHRKATKMQHVVSHASYLINPASPSRQTREKSIRLLRDEIERCETLDIPHLVIHPGAHMGLGEEKGIDRIVRAFDRVHKALPGYATVTCLEITAGQGTSIGHRFEHLRQIIDAVREPERLAVCFDSAHLLAAGYDLTSAAGARAVIEEADACFGLGLIRVWHLNDSKVPLGKRVDRHEHIGHGFVSLDALRTIVNHAAFLNVPKVLETAKEDTDKGEPWDAVNLRTLRRLVKRKRATKKRRKAR